MSETKETTMKNRNSKKKSAKKTAKKLSNAIIDIGVENLLRQIWTTPETLLPEAIGWLGYLLEKAALEMPQAVCDRFPADRSTGLGCAYHLLNVFTGMTMSDAFTIYAHFHNRGLTKKRALGYKGEPLN